MLRNLRTQILLWTILPLVILLLAFSITGARNHRDSMQALVAERNAALTLTLAHEMEAILAGYTTSFELLATSKVLQYGDKEAISSRLEEASQLIDAQLLVVPAGHDIDAQAESFNTMGASLPWAAEATNRVLSEPLRPPVTATRDGGMAFWGIPIAEREAWLLAGVPIARLREPLSGQRMGTYTLSDTLGQVLTGGPLPADMGSFNIENKKSGVFFTTESESQLVIAYAPISGTDWILIMREPWEPLVADVLRFERVIPFVLLSAGLVSLLTLFFGLRYLVQPLQALRHQAERIGAGDFEAASHPVGGVTEISKLHDTLNRMAHQIQRYQQALKGYLGAITSVQEEERARLARELHDGTVQMLIALNQRAQMAQRGLSRNPTRAAERLAELRTMISDGIEEVRRFSGALRPLYLEELGLAPAIEMLARSANATYQLVGTPKRLDDEKEVALYRIAGEALSNTRRHSQAKQIAISLTFTETAVTLQVRDDGIGFDVPTDFIDLARTGHFGLMGMHERAHFVGAQLQIDSAPGEGTTVTVSV
ncbi:MAG: histidine kinase [Ardenticatenaceae bacterium]